jgi:YD repeat-containing protein
MKQVVQPPIRNPSTLGAAVFGHSGEFGPSRTDLSLPGRGLHLAFVRSYRSSIADRVGELGRGWSASIAKRVEVADDDLLVHDGAGLVHRFAREGTVFASPAGYYGVIAEERRGIVLRHRHGVITRFDAPARGGRIRSVEDRNSNVIRFAYRNDRIEILDTLGRRIDVTLAKGRIQKVRDHAGRTWNYGYDRYDRLVEVVQPATRNDPAGTMYGYDDMHRLRSITDAKGQTWLVVRYDDAGRVVEQTHGTGTYTFAYESIGQGPTAGVRVTCGLKNGGTLVVDHDPAGHPVSRTLFVRRTAFDPVDVAVIDGDFVPLISTSSYNQHGECISRTEPAGDSITWVYAEDDDDPRNRGNCLRRTETPATGVSADQSSLVTNWTYDRGFQVPLSVTDPRGNTTSYRYDAKGNRIGTRFAPLTVQTVVGDEPDRPTPITLSLEASYAFNSRGQLLSKTHIDGAVTTFEYYPVADPTGRAGMGTATGDPRAICGYLARVTRDASGSRHRTGYQWDAYGNLVEVLDGQRNAVRLRYDPLGRLERVDGRGLAGDWIEYRYDANGNESESIQPFQRKEVDEASDKLVTRTGTIRELRSYDVLDRLVARTIVGGDTRVTERFVRDADERIVRLIQPTGAVTEVEYDERDLPIASTRAAGTKEAVTERRSYTANGDLRSETNGRGGTTRYHYDGFARHVGITDELGTRWTRSLDEAGNAVRLAVEAGDGEAVDEGASVGYNGGWRTPAASRPPLIETAVRYDEWGRPVRIDQAWRDPAGRALGASYWDGQEGVSSTLVEYIANGRPGRVWNEAGNVVTVAYDGLGQVASISDLTGEQAEFTYDANGNSAALSYRAPAIDRDGPRSNVRMRYDEMDRLVARQVDDDAPETFAYDTLGGVNGHRRDSGLQLRLLHDGLGRRIGQLVIGEDGGDGSAARILRRFEYDDAYRLTAHTDGAGNRTIYRYDAFDRQVGIIYADGAEAIAEYDANGNVVRTVDPRGTEITLRYDQGDRLVERRSRLAGSDATELESFEYDAIGRLVSVTTPTGELQRTYDSLSRVLTESQAGRTVRITYDAAGRATALDYPGGEGVRRTFDVRGRVTSVRSAAGALIANIEYRAGEQVARLVLGGVMEATCAYDGRGRLESVTYVRSDDRTLIEGFRYAYDDANRIVYEVQLSDGIGERYEFDAANRPVRARYGIRDVLDPNSPFELETSYEHFPEGLWRRRRDVDGRGIVIADHLGTMDARNRYRQFGGTNFTYDAAGNTIRKGTDNPGFCLYSYDAQDRLTKSECFDANARRTQTIEYEYDALGRLVRKTVTDSAGNVTVIEFVWSGSTLIEEYENGVLVRTYVYSLGTSPARLTVDRAGRSDYWYVHNGRGLAAGLVRATDPNAFAERYGYEITGFAFMKEIDGLKVDLPERVGTASTLWNSVLAGDAFGTLSRDWANGTMSGPGGRHLDPLIAAALNTSATIAGGVHNTLKMTVGKQFESFLGMLGLGGRSNGFISRGGAGGKGFQDKMQVATSNSGVKTKESRGGGGLGMGYSRMARDFSLYAAGDGGSSLFPSSGQNAAFDFSKGGGGSSGTSGASGGMSTGGLIGQLDAFKDTPAGQVTQAVLSFIVVSLATSKAGEKPGPREGDPPPGPGEVGPAQKNQQEQEDRAKREQQQKEREREQKEKEQKEKEQKEKEQKEKEQEPKGKDAKDDKEEQEADKKKKSGSTYVDPDQQYQTAIVSPEQIEMRLNGRKRPVNPNGGGGWEIDTSSPPQIYGGSDPTLERYDGETFGGLTLTSGEPKFPISPIRYVRDYEPPQPTFPPNGGGEDERDTGVP